MNDYLTCHNAATRRDFGILMHPKCVSGRDSAPDPAGGAYSTPPDPLAVFEGPLRGRKGEGKGGEGKGKEGREMDPRNFENRSTPMV